MRKVLFCLFIACSFYTQAQITQSSDFVVTVQKSVDGKQYKIVSNKHVPYASAAEFLSTIPSPRRHIGQIAFVANGDKVEMWQFMTCITDACFRRVGDTLNFTRDGDSIRLASSNSNKAVYAPTVTTGTGAPSSTPTGVGHLYVDTSGKKLYVSTGTTNSSDWTILN